ncbi:DUF397 domain-containing protein [Streptomyces sp. NPDC057854]|uniref:DUF397 domain-containing protein n=1 Tax=unclassified Streptomyces TaxID=2593676 RepID=UPI00368632BC
MSTTPDLTGVRWVASSYSGNGGGNCVEWAPSVAAVSGLVPVRDSKAPEGPALIFPAGKWDTFVKHITR